MSSIVVNTEQKTLQGITWMVVTGLLFVAVTGVVRHLGSQLPAVEAAFLRYSIGLIMISPAFLRLRHHRPGKRNMILYVCRGMVHGFAVMLWFYAMARIPIAEVTAIGYVSPIFVTLGAAFFLKEKLKFRRIMGIFIGFIGALIILRPGFETIKLGQLAQLTAAPLFATSFLIAKKLTDKSDPAVIVAMLSLFCTLTLLPGALWQWRPPTAEELSWLTLTALLATTGHYTLTQAFKAAPITVTQPIAFLQLVWATILGMVVFDEPLNLYVMLGGGLIVAAATYISHREAAIARKAITPPAPATKL